MPYQTIDYGHIPHGNMRKVVSHSDMMLHDLYNVFKLPEELTKYGGAGNFSVAVILLCIVDGLAVYLYPTKTIKSQENRVKKLLNDKFYWGPADKGWLEKEQAIDQFYRELRNPLVHELGADRSSSARFDGHAEPGIGLWGSIPHGSREIDLIQDMTVWNDEWPILTIGKNARGRDFVNFSGAGMWWSVKKLVTDLINDKSII